MSEQLWLAHCRTCLQTTGTCTIIFATEDADEALVWNEGQRDMITECVVCGVKHPGAARPADEFFCAMMNGEESDIDDYSQ